MTEKGLSQWEPRPHLVELLDLFSKHKYIILLKPKQIFVTTLMAGFALHHVMFTEGGNALILSKGEAEAAETLTYAALVHESLPDFLRLPKGKDQSSLMTFPLMHSKLRALPATEDAGVGFGRASLVILDEWEYHDYARQNLPEILAMVEHGGQLIILSTVDKTREDTKFKEVYTKARHGDNDFFPVFLPYSVLPERTEQWRTEQLNNFEPWEVECRYPRTEEEALAPMAAMCRFDGNALNAMKADVRDPLEERHNGTCKIYKSSVAGRKYCFAIDTAEGVEDPAVGLIIDWQTLEEVAEFRGFITVDEQARIVKELWTEYNRCYIAPEINTGDGQRLVEKLQAMGVTNFHLTEKDKPGWRTTSANRPVMISELAENIYLRQIRVYNRTALNEFSSFIRTKRKPDGEAMRGRHDDYVIAWAIALQLRKTTPSGEFVIASWKYKESL